MQVAPCWIMSILRCTATPSSHSVSVSLDNPLGVGAMLLGWCLHGTLAAELCLKLRVLTRSILAFASIAQVRCCLFRSNSLVHTSESHLLTSKAAVYARTARFGRIVVGR
ncbi:hypothetical protein F5Y08DRAFT_293055 [Xylaria arbuscula]|nr:hypothetical protein F5Y08DRAFT_293055 [Xylaria arbuscula]